MIDHDDQSEFESLVNQMPEVPCMVNEGELLEEYIRPLIYDITVKIIGFRDRSMPFEVIEIDLIKNYKKVYELGKNVGLGREIQINFGGEQ